MRQIKKQCPVTKLTRIITVNEDNVCVKFECEDTPTAAYYGRGVSDADANDIRVAYTKVWTGPDRAMRDMIEEHGLVFND